MEKITIVQPMGPYDIRLVQSLFREYATGSGLDLCFQGFDEELKTLPGKYSEPLGRLYLLFEGDTAAGCAGLRPLRDDIAEMKRLYVRPRFRRRGYARLLSEKLIAEARTIGYGAIYLDTVRSMVDARALYESLGFFECQPYYNNPLPDVCYMKLTL